ncbi:MAG: hypothetical protein ABI867_34695 [Kofleriaceae bacterium]
MMRWVVIASVLVGCGKKPPDEEAAFAAYNERKPQIAAFDGMLKHELEILALTVDTPEAIRATGDKLHSLESAFEAKLVKAVDEAGAVGAEIEFRQGIDRKKFLGGASTGACDLLDRVGKNDNVRVGDVFASKRDGRAIGRGLYQTSYERHGVNHGDGSWHPGINVRWTIEGPIATEVMLCFLLDGTGRPK